MHYKIPYFNIFPHESVKIHTEYGSLTPYSEYMQRVERKSKKKKNRMKKKQNNEGEKKK